MGFTRRDLLRFGLIGGAASLVPVGMVRAMEAMGSPNSTVRSVASSAVPAFKSALRIPPVLSPVRTTATTDFYEITERVAQVQIVPGLPPTQVWGFNGQFPGPTIRQRRGRDVMVRITNALPVPTSTHLHGGDVPPASDGHPADLVPPGGFRDHHYPGLHPAATLWYHDHAIHSTGGNVWRGLAGSYLVTDDVEAALPLPKGKFEVPLIIQD